MTFTRVDLDGAPQIDPQGDYVGRDVGDGAVEYAAKWGPYRQIRVTIADGSVVNDGTDTETVTVEVVDGLEIARGTDSANATVLDYGGDVTLTIDGVETTKSLTDGSVSFDVATEKPAGSAIEIVAESLADHPAESDRAEVEVIQT